MNEINETRKIRIAYVVIKTKDIITLLSDIEEIVSSLGFINNEVKIKIETDNDSIFESESILNLKDLLDNRNIQSVNFSFSNSAYINTSQSLYIDVKLNHSIYGSNNLITISGKNSVMINGITKKIEDNVHIWQKQFSFVDKHPLLSFLLIINLMSVILCILITKSLNLNLYEFKLKELILYFAGILLFSSVASNTIYSQFMRLWPVVELQTGEISNNGLQKKRRILWLIVSLLIIPVFISLVF